MGAGQSSQDRSTKDAAGAAVKTSYYELLGLEKQATDDEIKKAYRRKALELHPDRNYGDVERATALFAEVQSAYEVLSDPQERAWYDSHEDAILRDIDPHDTSQGQEQYERNVGLTTADDITRLFRKFNANVEFTDEKAGFFGFLQDFFQQLAKEEVAAVVRDGGSSHDVREYPSFGNKKDTDAEVRHFYGAWSGFATRKSFAWRDKYRTTDAENRWIRRQIEKENKRFREDGIAEFNEAVRALVAFVKKRDPRFKPDTRSEQERQQALRDAAKSQAARMRAANEAKMDQEVPAWAQSRQDDHDELEGTIDESESEEEQFECVACRKTFKSEKQFEAHEKSKKHIKTVQALRRKLQKEGVELDLDEPAAVDEPSGTQASNAIANDGEQNEDHVHVSQELPSTSELDDMEDLTNAAASFTMDSSYDDLANAEDSESSQAERVEHSDAESSTEDEAKAKTVLSISDVDSDSAQQTVQPQIKLGKAAQKRAKKAAKQAEDSRGSTPHKCASCDTSFSSKTQLFQHIRDFGHAAPKAATGNVKGPKGKRR